MGQVAPLQSAAPGETGFATETAAATGKSKTAVNKSIRRATEVCQEARDLIRGTKLDTGTFLDRLANEVREVEKEVK